MPDGVRSFSMEAVNGEAIIGDNNYFCLGPSQEQFGYSKIRA